MKRINQFLIVSVLFVLSTGTSHGQRFWVECYQAPEQYVLTSEQESFINRICITCNTDVRTYTDLLMVIDRFGNPYWRENGWATSSHLANEVYKSVAGNHEWWKSNKHPTPFDDTDKIWGNSIWDFEEAARLVVEAYEKDSKTAIREALLRLADHTRHCELAREAMNRELETLPKKAPMSPQGEHADESWKHIHVVQDNSDGSDIPPPDTFIPFEKPPQPLEDHCPQPQTPERARADKIDGRVIVQVYVNTEGKIQAWKIVKVKPEGYGLEEAVASVIELWRFSPAIHVGEPVGVWLSIPFDFKN